MAEAQTGRRWGNLNQRQLRKCHGMCFKMSLLWEKKIIMLIFKPQISKTQQNVPESVHIYIYIFIFIFIIKKLNPFKDL